MSSSIITQKLRLWCEGKEDALNDLFPLVLKELRRRAAYLMQRERARHPLQATALVNEAYFKLRRVKNVSWQNRGHFYRIAARAMRQVLVEYARKDKLRFILVEALDDFSPGEPSHNVLEAEDLLALDLALERLAKLHARKARVIELSYFGGLKNGEIAQILNISENTVMKHKRYAEAWLRRELKNSKRQ